MMSKVKGPSIYYYHDKAIHDGLSQHNLNKKKINSMLLQKGVLVSEDNEKEDSVLYLSSFIFDFHDRSTLSDAIRTYPKREHIKSIQIKNSTDPSSPKITRDSYRNVLKQLKESFDNDEDVIATIHNSENGSGGSILFEYKSFDLTKPEMKQIEKKKAVVEVIYGEDGLTIRSPANDFCDSVVIDFRRRLEKEVSVDLKTEEINLSGIRDEKLVSKFFQLLIDNIEGYNFHDVTNVKLYHPNIEIDEDEEREGSDIVISNIRKAILQGEKVMTSPELNSLFSRGFHISTIQWNSDEDSVSASGDRVCFEASLNDPENKTNFTYQVRYVLRYSDRTGNITTKRDTPSSIEKKTYHDLLEKSARLSYSKILKEQEESNE